MTKRIEPTHPVTAGSYWHDAFLPGAGRVVKVMGIDETHATIMTLVNDHKVQRDLDLPISATNGPLHPRDMRGTVRRIRLDRFRNTLKGFVHLEDGPAEVARRDRELAEWREALMDTTAQQDEDLNRYLAVDPLNAESLSIDASSVKFSDLPAEETIVL